MLSLCAGHAAVLFDELQVLMRPIALSHGPFRSSGEHGIHRMFIQTNLPRASHAGRNAVKQGVGQQFFHRLDLLDRQSGAKQTDSAGNVEAHAAGRHHAAEIGIECGDPADGKPIAPMSIRHRIGRLDDAGQRGHVGHLLVHFLVHMVNQLFGSVDHTRHSHLAARRDVPFVPLASFQ